LSIGSAQYRSIHGEDYQPTYLTDPVNQATIEPNPQPAQVAENATAESCWPPADPFESDACVASTDNPNKGGDAIRRNR
jgi:hypothetical protein